MTLESQVVYFLSSLAHMDSKNNEHPNVINIEIINAYYICVIHKVSSVQCESNQYKFQAQKNSRQKQIFNLNFKHVRDSFDKIGKLKD